MDNHGEIKEQRFVYCAARNPAWMVDIPMEHTFPQSWHSHKVQQP